MQKQHRLDKDNGTSNTPKSTQNNVAHHYAQTHSRKTFTNQIAKKQIPLV